MLDQLLIPAWTLFSVTVGVVLGYAITRAAADTETGDADDGPGAVGPDELDD